MPLRERSHAFVFEPGSIAAPACHAATVLPLPGGGLLCAFFAGSREGQPDVGIWWSERSGPGSKWSEPRLLPRVCEAPHWNPVLFAAGGLAHLVFKVGPTPRRWDSWRCTRPLGAAAEWSAAEELVPGDRWPRGPVKNKPLRLRDGALLAPASIESWWAWDCFADRSEDEGRTWQRSARVPFDHLRYGRGIIQPAFWESDDGGVHLLARSRGAGCLFRARSEDGGRSWSAAEPTIHPSNDSGIDLIRLPGGELLMAINPVDQRRVRTPLWLVGSRDDGAHFERAVVLEDEPGEYSYPAVVETPEGVVVAYTWNRRSIVVREFDVVD